MRLLDRVVQAKESVVVGRPGEVWRLPGADALAANLAACPLRYVLGDDVTAVCTRLAFEDDTILGSSLELVHVPAPTLWVEFESGARRQVFSDLGRLGTAGALQRIGLLATSDKRGRSGTIEVCWESTEGLGLDLAPFIIEYDFGPLPQDGTGSSIGVTVRDHPGLDTLYKHVRFTLRPPWQRYYAHVARSDAAYREALRKAVDPVLEDVPFFAMFCLLLSSKHALHERPTDRSSLNAARARRDRPPLLDHVEVSMNLAGGTGSASAGERSSPRLHFVRGHLVRRGDAVYWRTSHMRGKAEAGSIRSRTVSLRIASV